MEDTKCQNIIFREKQPLASEKVKRMEIMLETIFIKSVVRIVYCAVCKYKYFSVSKTFFHLKITISLVSPYLGGTAAG